MFYFCFWLELDTEDPWSRYKGSNTGKRARRKNIIHLRERFLVSNEAPPSWRPIYIFPAAVWDFSVLPSCWCLILFLTNFPILYVFSCLILFLTKSCLHSIERFPAKLFSVDEVNCRFIDIHPCIGSILIVFHNKNTMYLINILSSKSFI